MGSEMCIRDRCFLVPDEYVHAADSETCHPIPPQLTGRQKVITDVKPWSTIIESQAGVSTLFINVLRSLVMGHLIIMII